MSETSTLPDINIVIMHPYIRKSSFLLQALPCWKLRQKVLNFSIVSLSGLQQGQIIPAIDIFKVEPPPSPRWSAIKISEDNT